MGAQEPRPSSSYCQLTLLRYVDSKWPKDAWVILVGDEEYGAIEVLRQLGQCNKQNVLYQKSNELVCPMPIRIGQRLVR
jgi:hypothetical protein